MMPLQDTPPQGLDADHRANRLLAALEPEDFAGLEPHLESVELTRGQVLYDTGEAVSHTYFPHDTVVSLVNVLEDGSTVEVAVFGREGVLGLLSARRTRPSGATSCRCPAPPRAFRSSA